MKVVSRKSVKVRLETVGWMNGWMVFIKEKSPQRPQTSI